MSEIEYSEVIIRVAKPILEFLKSFKIDPKEYCEKAIENQFGAELDAFMGDPTVFIDDNRLNEVKKIPIISEYMKEKIVKA